MSELREYAGCCHCRAVTFSVRAPNTVELERCNCSICRKSGYLHMIVPKSRFRVLSGEDRLACYQFNTGVAKHYFCNTCGVKPFYVPRSNPDGIDINFNCLDSRPEDVTVVEFDGQNWEANAHTLAHKSKESSE
ncbi:MAG: GFA family protein [Pseudomonadota bacterium]